ncbi:zinc-dependent metalloprotease [Cellulomonas alba]|uniref:Zinc-dependent metalloprotease n=1 Tax=Cellulomonas alba TaxID=3053467 RepID=A0ABT7SGN1_9CELL|nr:zinc-dependent metalloprotease [Cellulomonas alba]MDM7855352.1 zinc-dependent metalloprotease [Cellulomonas alba]
MELEQAGPVDWPTAARIAGRLAAPGPSASREELTALVAELRSAAGRAAEHASRITQLTPADGSAPAQASRVLVVDRARWAAANTEVFASMVGPVTVRGRPVPPAARAAGAVQVGGVLALLAGKVLGQFDPFGGADGEPGRLLLVAPNVLQVERQIGVDPSDFRLWVSLHEQTHALQFAAAPWLAVHLRARAAELLEDLAGPRGLASSAAELVEGLVRALTQPGGSVLDVLPPAQREAFEEVSAVMALLEGHADVAMDEVGPGVVPSVRDIRRKFEARRDENARAGGVDRLLRRLLGMDAKLAQYRDGAAFVRGVQAEVGVAGLNAVFAAPENLPSRREVSDPRAWVRRVHG